MAAVKTSSPLPALMSLRQAPSYAERRPLTVSATFFQHSKSEEEPEEEEEEEEEVSELEKKIIKLTIIHGGKSQSSENDRKSASPDNSVTGTLLRSRSTSVLAVDEKEKQEDEEVDIPDVDVIDDDDPNDDEECEESSESREHQEVKENGNLEQQLDEDCADQQEGDEDEQEEQKVPEILVQGLDGSDEEASSGGKEDDESGDEHGEKELDQNVDEEEDSNLLCTGKRVQRKISRSEELEPEQLVSKIAEYERISTVGTGSFGRVILVQHRSGGYYALKLMGIREVIRNRQIEHVHSEKNILLSVDHPFIIKLHWAYHDTKFLYMLFDYVPGGELFSYLRCARKFCNYTARFYAAEIVLALEYLHSAHIVYRDLKPENILLDKDGHARLTDFGFAKMITEGRTWTMCGTPEYLAPEIVVGKGHNTAVDWWSLGVLVYEMLTGRTPFPGKESDDVYEQILKTRPAFSRGFDPAAKDLIKRLLVVNRVKRLGNLKGNAADVKAHKWFNGVDWRAIYEKRVEPPIKPTVNGEGDTGNYDEYDEDLSQVSEGTRDDLEMFEDW